ncbi:MAG TPA: glycoside hydrolase family 5 protein [Candidatus Acidoferrum sp.]|nr:glycoside hydrolase family 5 protein [Candidatus Acidoferrum sp.]
MKCFRIMRCIGLLTILGCFASSLLSAQSSSVSAEHLSSSVLASRVARLRHGINASEWFAQVYDKRGYTREHFQNWTTADDVVLIKSMGFDHVRLSVNPQPMMANHAPDEISTEYFGYLDAAVKMILDQGLAVVIDLHPDSDFKSKLAKEDSFVQQFADFWRALARHYSTWDTERVFFEILNEPEFSDRYRWYGVQARLAAAIRERAPQHTIIAAGARWSDEDELVFLEPLRDPNVIYNFHFYEPHIFTHQGATWGEYFWHWVKGLHYPSSPDSAAKVAAAVPDAADRLAVIRYGQDHWDAQRIDAEITQVAEWAQQRGVPLVCNEFGVYRAYVNPDDREAWIHDIRTVLERHGVGWTMWDYSGSFGVVTKKDGRSVPDEATLRALGLTRQAGK